MDEDKFSKYPTTVNIRPIDVLIAPHPFCITHHHVAYAHDHHCGMLTPEAVDESGAPCGVPGCQLKFSQHEKVLLLEVASNEDLKNVPGLHEYLLEIKEMATKDGYAGFAFKQKRIP